MADIAAGRYFSYSAHRRQSGEQQCVSCTGTGGQPDFPQRANAGPTGNDAAAHAEPRTWFVKSHGATAVGFRHRLSSHSDRRYFTNGGANAINCAILRTIIQ